MYIYIYTHTYNTQVLEKAVTAPKSSLLIGSVLDTQTDVHANTCRIVFHGRILETIDPQNAAAMAALRVNEFKNKSGGITRFD